VAEIMEIVDCHMHLWTPQTHPWVLNVKDGGHPAGPFKDVLTYSVNEYVKDVGKYNVTHSVHVEACWPDDPVNETKWLDQIADSNPRQYPQAIVGHADLSADNLEDVLMRHCQSKRIRGIRHMLNFHSEKPQYSEVEHDNFLTDPKWQRGLELLEKYNLSFEIHILPRQMKRAAEVVSKYPKVWFMVDHCGIPYEKDDVSMTIWREGTIIYGN
jgi:predicted TIM-barrel fold metal-dependent hydrolase